MTTWLKWRLCAFFGTSLLIGGATFLHAQNSYPAPPKTPEEAGKQFLQLLDSVHGGKDPFPYTDDQYAISNTAVNIAVYEEDDLQVLYPAKNGAVSRAQYEAFDGPPSKLRDLLERLYVKTQEPSYEARVVTSEGNRTIVAVSPVPSPRPLEIVTIAEDGGYRVDLKATYGKWHNLSGEPLDEQWYRLTGIVSQSLQSNGNFLRTQCQTRLKQQMLGILQYSQDYDERLPPASKWMDVLQPYVVKSKQLFECPSLATKGHGYAYNQYLSQFPAWRLASPATTIHIYETSNPRRNWFGPGTGRANRHFSGWNLAFADGHVKWFGKDLPHESNYPFKPAMTRENSMSSGPGLPPPIDSTFPGAPPPLPY